MATSVQSIIDGVRSILQDTVTPYRYSDDDLVSAVNYTLQTISRLRPDLFIGNYPINLTPVTISDDIPSEISDVYTPQIVAYVAGWAELRDDEYTEDGRAATLLSSLKSGLQ